jgi:hypothetical protein
MRGLALAAPLIVLAAVLLLQRLEVWATDASPEVSQRRSQGEASDHG